MRKRDALKEIQSLLGDARSQSGYRLWEVFRDWLECSAIAVSNSTDLQQAPAREARYMILAEKHGPETMGIFSRCFALLVAALQDEPSDILGELFMTLDFGDSHLGQFFTPNEVSRLLAQITIGDGQHLQDHINQVGFVTVHEPTSGAGGMIIAFAEEMKRAGFNPQTQLHVSAMELDIDAVHMTFLQLSLLGIPAEIIHGNVLTLEVRSIWRTPFHILGLWDHKFRRTQREATAPLQLPAGPTEQPGLFGGAA